MSDSVYCFGMTQTQQQQPQQHFSRTKWETDPKDQWIINEWMNKWMSEWRNKWRKGATIKWRIEVSDEWIKEWTNGWSEWRKGATIDWRKEGRKGWRKGWMDAGINEGSREWTNGRMSEWMNEGRKEWNKINITCNRLPYEGVRFSRKLNTLLSSSREDETFVPNFISSRHSESIIQVSDLELHWPNNFVATN